MTLMRGADRLALLNQSLDVSAFLRRGARLFKKPRTPVYPGEHTMTHSNAPDILTGPMPLSANPDILSPSAVEILNRHLTPPETAAPGDILAVIRGYKMGYRGHLLALETTHIILQTEEGPRFCAINNISPDHYPAIAQILLGLALDTSMTQQIEAWANAMDPEDGESFYLDAWVMPGAVLIAPENPENTLEQFASDWEDDSDVDLSPICRLILHATTSAHDLARLTPRLKAIIGIWNGFHGTLEKPLYDNIVVQASLPRSFTD